MHVVSDADEYHRSPALFVLEKTVNLLGADGALTAGRHSDGRVELFHWWPQTSPWVDGEEWAKAVLRRVGDRLGGETRWAEIRQPWAAGALPSAEGVCLAVPLSSPNERDVSVYMVVVNPRADAAHAEAAAELARALYAADTELLNKRARLARELRRNEKLQRLIETALMISSKRRLEDVLQAVVSQARLHTGCDVAHILLKDERDGMFAVRVSDGLQTADYSSVRLHPERGIVGAVARTRRAVSSIRLLSDQRRNKEYDDLLRAEGIVSGLCSPMIVRDELIGMLYLLTRNARAFEPDEIALVDNLAGVAAIAVDNARLFRQQEAALEEISQLHQVTERQARWLQTALETHQRLIEILLTGQGIGAVASFLAERLRADIVLETPDYHILASGHLGASRADGPRLSLKEEAAHARFRSLVEEVKRTGRSVQLPPAAGRGWRIVVPVGAGPDFFGFLSVIGGKRPFHEREVAIAEQAALIVALEMVKQKAVDDAEERLGSDLVVRLVSGGLKEGVGLLRRSQKLGYDLEGRHVVMVLQPNDHEDDGSLDNSLRGETDALAAVRRVLARQRAQGIVGRNDGLLVVLLRLGVRGEVPYRDRALKLFRYVDAALPGGLRAGGLSEPVEAKDFPEGYRQATVSLNVAARLGARPGLQCFSDLGVLRLLAQVDNTPDVQSFVGKTLGPLLEYDRENNGELLETLFQYLRCNQNARATAEALFVHPNTLRYRLRRIEEIGGFSLSDPEAMLDAYMSLKVLHLQGHFKDHRTS